MNGNQCIIVLRTADWIWIAALVLIIGGGFWFVDRLLRKGVYDVDTGGSSRLGSAISDLQSLFDPSHRHVAEERERKRAEHDDSGDPPEAGSA